VHKPRKPRLPILFACGWELFFFRVFFFSSTVLWEPTHPSPGMVDADNRYGGGTPSGPVEHSATRHSTGSTVSGGGVCGRVATAWASLRRSLLADVVARPWFDRVVLLVIVANSVCLALDQPLADQASGRQRTLAVLDVVRVSAGSSARVVVGVGRDEVFVVLGSCTSSHA
jgi:hypothetical protein